MLCLQSPSQVKDQHHSAIPDHARTHASLLFVDIAEGWWAIASIQDQCRGRHADEHWRDRIASTICMSLDCPLCILFQMPLTPLSGLLILLTYRSTTSTLCGMCKTPMCVLVWDVQDSDVRAHPLHQWRSGTSRVPYSPVALCSIAATSHVQAGCPRRWVGGD